MQTNINISVTELKIDAIFFNIIWWTLLNFFFLFVQYDVTRVL